MQWRLVEGVDHRVADAIKHKILELVTQCRDPARPSRVTRASRARVYRCLCPLVLLVRNSSLKHYPTTILRRPSTSKRHAAVCTHGYVILIAQSALDTEWHQRTSR